MFLCRNCREGTRTNDPARAKQTKHIEPRSLPPKKLKTVKHHCAQKPDQPCSSCSALHRTGGLAAADDDDDDDGGGDNDVDTMLMLIQAYSGDDDDDGGDDDAH